MGSSAFCQARHLTVMTPFLDCNWQCKSYKGKAVCGSDGKTYKNKCVLNCKAKKDKKKVSVKKQGPCGKQPPKGCDLQCQGDKGKAVCGSDGKTYKNKCLLNCKAKKDKRKVSI